MAGKSYQQQAKTKAEIAKKKSLVTKQRIKEKEKAATKSEKKDLDATPKARSTAGGIHRGKSKNIEVSTPKKHPAHDPEKGGIHAGKPDKKHKKDKDHKGPIIKIIEKIIGKNGKAKAEEVKPKVKKKPLSPEQKKKDKAIMKAEEARRAKGKALKAKQDSAAIMKAEKARRDKAKKATKKKADAKANGRSLAASGATKKKEKAAKKAERMKHVAEPTGRSSAASGAYKKKEAAERKKHIKGEVKSAPSGSR